MLYDSQAWVKPACQHVCCAMSVSERQKRLPELCAGQLTSADNSCCATPGVGPGVGAEDAVAPENCWVMPQPAPLVSAAGHCP